jgi:hypothetical protein
MSRTIDSIGLLPLPPLTTGPNPIETTSMLFIDYLVTRSWSAFAIQFDRSAAGTATR